MKKSQLIKIIKEEITTVIKNARVVDIDHIDESTLHDTSSGPGPTPMGAVRTAIESSLVDGETVKQKAEILYTGRKLAQLQLDFPEGWQKMKKTQIVRKILEKHNPYIRQLTDKQINDSLNQLSVGA